MTENERATMISAKGRNVVGLRMTCEYQGSKDPAPVKIEGVVCSQRKIEGKGNLLGIQTSDGFRSIYYEKAVNLLFYIPRERVENTDDGVDAWKDSQMEQYGSLPRKSDGTVRWPS